jgi:hypothetical protein
MNRSIGIRAMKNKANAFLRPSFDFKPYSRLGLASFAAALVTGLLVILDISTALRLQQDSSAVQNLRTVDLWLTWAMLALSAAGVLLGFTAVVQRQKKRLFGVVGLVFNSLFLLAILILYLSNLVAFWQLAAP